MSAVLQNQRATSASLSTSDAAEKVVTAVVNAIGVNPQKLAKAEQVCALNIKSWDVGIHLTSKTLDVPKELWQPLADFSRAAFGDSAFDSQIGGALRREVLKREVELNDLPPHLATKLRGVTPRGIQPVLRVTSTVGRGWGSELERWCDVSLVVRGAK